MLRVFLGGYLKLYPEQVPIGYSSFGKPILTEPRHPYDLKFNLAHSDGLALYAFSRSHRIGIDLEYIRPDFATAEIAQRFCSPVRSPLRSLDIAPLPPVVCQFSKIGVVFDFRPIFS